MKDIFKIKKGFTLVEILIYIAIFSMVISVVFSYFLMINSLNNKNIVISRLENNSRFIFSTLGNKILDTKEIEYPQSGQASSTLILNISNESFKIFEDNSNILIKKNNDLAQNLNLPKIIIKDLSFFVTGDEGKNIKISFVLESGMKGIRDVYYRKKFYNSFSIR